LTVEEHDRLVRELELRGQDELTRLRQAIAAKAPQAEADSRLSHAVAPATAELSGASSLQFAAPSACDVTASRLHHEGRLVAAGAAEGGIPDRRRAPRFLRETFGDLRVCLRIDEGNVFETVRPSELLGRAGYSVLEAQRNGLIQRLELARGPDGAARPDWRVNGVSRPVDADVRAWQSRIVDLLDTSWEIFALQGQEGELLGEMSLVRSKRKVDALRAQIVSLTVDERIAEWNSLRAGQVERLRAAMAVIP
jgi:hypothetical protein